MNFFKFFKAKDWIYVVFMVAFVILQVFLELKIPGCMREITQVIQGVAGEDVVSEILQIGAKMLALTLASSLVAVVVGYACSIVSANVAMRMRKGVFYKVQMFGFNEVKKFSVPSLITRSTNDITQIQSTINMTLRMVRAPVMAIYTVAIITSNSWQWSVATAVAVAIMVALIIILICFAIPKFKQIQVLTDNLNSVTRENLTGLRVVRAYNAEKYEGKKFEKANTDVTKTNLFVTRLMALLGPVITLVSTTLSLAIYWIGAYIIDGAAAPDKVALFGDMVVFMSYAMMLLMSFMAFTMVFIMLPRAIVCYKRVNEVLDTKISVSDGDGSKTPTETGTVEFKNVCFKYKNSEEYVLKDISFKAEKGQTVAFIGSTGSGKSTLINLIPRFFDVTHGQVLVDGVNVKNYKKNDLIDKIGYVSQNAVLFSGTVKSNLAFGSDENKEILDTDITNALSIAQANSFVSKMPDGINSSIAQGGSNVSGGQKQRLSIARAIYKNPEILIFDDSFSALDYKTDKALRDALKEKTSEKTNLIVAQRIGTIKNADKIIVLDEGKIVGMGTHKQLLKNCSVYKEIALSQLSEEEL